MMPNKTIYIKESDVQLWERAQRELGESISSAFVDYLKGRLEMAKTKTIEETQAIDALLAEINAELGLNIELHPFWQYPILDQNTLNHGYKLHQKRANPDRIVSLVVGPLDFDRSGKVNPGPKERIKSAIQSFWDGSTTETHRFVDATKGS